MSNLNDFYYHIATKQEASELWARADEERLGKIARAARRHNRSVQRNRAALAAAAEGRTRSPWAAIKAFFSDAPAVVETPAPEAPVEEQVREEERVGC